MPAVADRVELVDVASRVALVEIVFTAEDDEHTACSRCHGHLLFVDARLVGADWLCERCDEPAELD